LTPPLVRTCSTLPPPCRHTKNFKVFAPKKCGRPH